LFEATALVAGGARAMPEQAKLTEPVGSVAAMLCEHRTSSMRRCGANLHARRGEGRCHTDACPPARSYNVMTLNSMLLHDNAWIACSCMPAAIAAVSASRAGVAK